MSCDIYFFISKSHYKDKEVRKLREELRCRRENQGMSTREVSAKSGIPKTRYNEIELGRIDPSPTEALKICKVLGCEFPDIFSDLIKEFQKEAAIRSALVAGMHIKAVLNTERG